MTDLPTGKKDFDEQGYSEKDGLLANALVVECYDQLLQIARQRRRRARTADTFMTHDLLHETLIKLGDLHGVRTVTHLLKAASLAMRQVVIDHARRKLAAKRQADPATLEDDPLDAFSDSPEQIVAIGRAMDELATANPRWLTIVDARYFGGHTEEETATLLGLSSRTVRRDWTEAKEWLARRLA